MLAQIDTLTDAEAAELHARLSLRLSKKRDFNSNERDTFDAVCTACGTRGPQNLDKFVTDFGVGKFRAAVVTVQDYLTHGSSLVLRRTVRRAVLELLFDCHADNLRERGIPAAPSTLLSNVATLPWSVEESFPGYAAARLLHKLAALAPA